MSCVTGSRGGVFWYLKKLSVGFGTVRDGEGSPFCSGLLDVGDCNSVICAFSASIWALIPGCISLLCLKSSSNLCSRRSATSKLSSSCLWNWGSMLDLLFGGPRGRFSPPAAPSISVYWCTVYLPVLADSVRAPTALFQVNFPTLARSHSGAGDFHRAGHSSGAGLE